MHLYIFIYFQLFLANIDFVARLLPKIEPQEILFNKSFENSKEEIQIDK